MSETTSPPVASTGLINRNAASQSPDAKCGGGEPRGVPRPDTKGKATGGPGHFDTPEAINNYATWSVTTITYGERYWGCRCDFIGISYILSLTLSRAPAIRIVVLGFSLWMGRVPQRPKVVTQTGASATG